MIFDILFNKAMISSIGLVLDIIGVCIIFYFGLPQNIDRNGAIHIVTEGVDEEEKKKAIFFDKMSYLGLSLVLIGFGLQIWSNYLK